MTKDAFLKMLESLIESAPGTLKGPEKLESVQGWDSLAVVGLIGLVDKHFQMALNVEDINKAKTVDDLVKLLGSNITG